MLDSLYQILISSIAVYGIIDIYHHSYIGKSLRAVANLVPLDFIKKGLTCPYCLSHWVSALCLFCTQKEIPNTILEWGTFIVCVFVVAKLSNFLNDRLKWVFDENNRKTSIIGNFNEDARRNIAYKQMMKNRTAGEVKSGENIQVGGGQGQEIVLPPGQGKVYNPFNNNYSNNQGSVQNKM